MTALITILTLALVIPLGERNGDQAGINYCPHLTFPPLPIAFRGRSVLPYLSFLSLAPKLPAGNVFPIDSSCIQHLGFELTTSRVSYLSLWEICCCSLHPRCSLAGSAPIPAP